MTQLNTNDVLRSMDPSRNYAPLPSSGGRSDFLRSQNAANAKPEGAFKTAFANAVFSESLLAAPIFALDRHASIQDGEVGEIYGGFSSLPKAEQDTFMEAIPSDQWYLLGSARSQEELYRVAGRLMVYNASRNSLESMGLAGTALRVGASFLDPVAIAVYAATGGGALVGAQIKALTTTARVGRVARSGFVVAGIDTLLQAPKVGIDPEFEPLDLAYGAAISFGLGAGIGALSDKLKISSAAAAKRIELSDLNRESRIAIADGRASAVDFAETGTGVTSSAGRGKQVASVEARGTEIPPPDGVVPAPNSPRQSKPTMREQIKNLLTPEGRAYYDDVLSDDARAALLREMAESAHLEPEDIDEFVTWDKDDALDFLLDGSNIDKDIAPTFGELQNTFATKGTADTPGGWWDYIRLSIGGQVSRSAKRSANAAFAGRAFAQDVQSVGGEAGSIWKIKQMNSLKRRVFKKSDELRRSHNNEAGASLSSREWNEQVKLAVVGAEHNTQFPKHIEEAAGVYRKEYARLRDMAEAHGVKNFDKIPSDPKYVNRLFDHQKINKMIGEFGEGPILKLLTQALREGRANKIIAESGLEGTIAAKARRVALLTGDEVGGATTAEFERIAAGYLKKVRSLEDNAVRQSGHFDGVDADDIEEILKRELGDVHSTEELADLAKRLRSETTDTSAPKKKGKPSKEKPLNVAKRRSALFDEASTIEHAHTNADGVEEVITLGFTDLFENDIGVLMNHYSNAVLGEMVSTTVRRDVGTRMGKVFDTFDEMAAALRKDGANKGDIDTLRFLDNHARGIYMGATTEIGQKTVAAGRMLRFGNVMRIAGQFMFAQIPELAATYADAGLRATIQQMPTFRGILQFAKDGRLTTEISRDMQQIFSTVDDAWLHLMTNMTDGGFLEQSALKMGKVQQLLKSGADLTVTLSGLRHIDSYSRVAAAKTGLQSVVNHAISGRISETKLRLLGLTRDEWENVIAPAIRREVKDGEGLTTVRGVWGEKMTRFEPSKFEDARAAARLVQGVDHWATRAVQLNDVGQLTAFMTTEAGRTIFQFQTFNIAAWDKQFVTFIRNPFDAHIAARVAVSTFAGAGVWTGRQYAVSLVQDDPQGWRDEHLTLGKIVRAGAQRGGTLGIGSQLIDFSASIVGDGPIFDARNSGLGALEFPTLQFLDAAIFKAPPKVIDAVTGRDDTSEQDVNKMMQLLPFRTLPGLKLFSEGLVQQNFEDEER